MANPKAAGKGPNAPADQGKTPSKKPKKVKPPRKLYCYTEANKGLPVFGVLAQWKTKKNEKTYSDKELVALFEPKLAAFREPKAPQEEQAPGDAQEAKAGSSKESAAEGQKKTGDKGKKQSGLKRKQFPYLRRLGPNKTIVTFGDMKQANQFAKFRKEGPFKFSIPLRFVSTMAVFEYKHVEFQENEIVLPKGYEMLECESKKPSNGTMQVIVAVRGSNIPDTCTFKGEEVALTAVKGKVALCKKCLRFGHVKENCMRRERCGFCEKQHPSAGHTENDCEVRDKSNRCIHCGEEQPTGHEGCDELNRQHKYKMNLLKHNLDYLTVVERMYLQMIRNTKPNSEYQKPTTNEPTKPSKSPKDPQPPSKQLRSSKDQKPPTKQLSKQLRSSKDQKQPWRSGK